MLVAASPRRSGRVARRLASALLAFLCGGGLFLSTVDDAGPATPLAAPSLTVSVSAGLPIVDDALTELLSESPAGSRPQSAATVAFEAPAPPVDTVEAAAGPVADTTVQPIKIAVLTSRQERAPPSSTM